MKKNTFALIALIVIAACAAVKAQTFTPSGQVVRIAAPAMPNNFMVISNADGSTQRYFGDRYNFWVGKSPTVGTIFDTQTVTPGGTNDVLSVQITNAYSSANWHWVTVSNSVTGSNSVPSPAILVVVPPPPVIYVYPLQAPGSVTVLPATGTAATVTNLK